ncbi:MAG: hypothetical protein HZB53_06530, partial [Chloroflexi bacterium]|nr:hypothetical protein [Chloroflexota bacterium]
MILNDAGSIVEEVWNDLPRHFPIVELDAFVIMPNHVHGVIVLVGESDNTANAENARLHGL